MVSGYTFFASQRMKKISSLLSIPIQKYLPQDGARHAAREKSLSKQFILSAVLKS